MAWSNNLFYIAFLGQIFVLSWYLPNKLLTRMRYVMETYPPATYPKLYPRPVEYYKMAQLMFKYVNRLILVLGFVILYAILFWVDHSTFADDGFISEFWPTAYGMIQFLPVIAVEISEFSQFRQMRKARPPSKRTADLRRRGLTNLVSPRLLGVVIVLFLGSVVFDFYVNDFSVAWGDGPIERALLMTGTYSLFALIGAWNLYGRKQDPHQSADDRIQRISVNIKSMIYVSMALSVFMATTAADERYDLDFIDAVVMSVYFQVIALLSLGYTLNSVKPDEIDFDVYRSDVAAE